MSNYLIHWAVKRDAAEREGHKYIARIWTNSSWRYFYDAKELAAFRRDKERKGEQVRVQFADGKGGFKSRQSTNQELNRKITSTKDRAHQVIQTGKSATKEIFNKLGLSDDIAGLKAKARGKLNEVNAKLEGINKDPASLRAKRDAETAARLEKYKDRIDAVEQQRAQKAAELEAKRAARAAAKSNEHPTIPEEEDGKKKGSSGGRGGGGGGRSGKGSGASKNPNAVGQLANLPLKDRTYTADEDMRAVNPNRGKGKEYDQNDVNCALAYDMRRRGFDVTAKGTNEPAGPEQFAEWYRDCKFTEIEQSPSAKGDYGSYAVSKVLSDLGQQPDGSYGMLYISWADGGGHAVNWAIENNKLVFRDCQSGKIIDLASMANDISFMQYARTDNLKLTDKAMEGVEGTKKTGNTATTDKSVVQTQNDKDDTKSKTKSKSSKKSTNKSKK